MDSFPENPIEFALEAISRRDEEVAEALLDGRRMRTEKGRSTVVDAILTLVRSGARPTVADIAEVSGISERTIFRYFPDRNSMFAACAVEVLSSIAHCFTIHPIDGDLDARVRRLVELRVEGTLIGGKFAEWVEGTDNLSPAQTLLITMRDEQFRTQIANWFAPELAGDDAELIPVLNAFLMHRPIGMLLDQLPREQVVDLLVVAVGRMLRKS